jgi:hypothetical protein
MLNKILDPLQKLLWGLCFITVVAFLVIFPVTETGCNTCARAVCYVFGFDGFEGHWLNGNLDEIVEAGPYPKAIKNAQKFERWEKKSVEKQKKRAAKQRKTAAKRKTSESKTNTENMRVFGYTYPSRYMLVYDLSGDYDKALEWAKKREEIPRPAERQGVVCGSILPSQYEFAAVARLHYKAGDKKQAFLDYVDLYNNAVMAGSKPLEEQDSSKIAEIIDHMQFLLTLHERDEPIRYQYYQETSCFDYLGFLAFMDAEYEKLGKPSEYEAAMAYYHGLENEAALKAYWAARLINEKDVSSYSMNDRPVRQE